MADPDTPGPEDAETIRRLLAAAQRRPDLPDIPLPARAGGDEPAGAAPSAPEVDPRALDPRRRRIRDRYIGVRFAGIARGGEDLENPGRVIKAARIALEEEQPDAALELLQLAIEQDPREPRLRLAELEIAYVLRDARRFVAAARAFRDTFAGHAAWNEAARLGRALAPGEALFGTPAPGAGHGGGPWPEPPNWIEAPRDHSPEAAAAEFHRAMTQDARDGG